MKTTRILASALTLAFISVAPISAKAENAGTETTRATTQDTRPGFIGVELIPVETSTRALFKLPATGGLLITGIGRGSPAEGKLGQGDILLKLDDQTLINREQLRALVRARRVGESVSLTIARGGRTETLKLTLAEAPPSPTADLGNIAIPEIFREMHNHTRRALREAGQAESLLDGTDDVVVLSPGIKTEAKIAAARTAIKAEGSVTILQRDGKSFVTVKNKEGKTIADGELNDELRKTLPEWARSTIGEMPAAARE